MQPADVVRSLLDAVNRHDADAMADHFSPDYRSEQPVHPARGFGGADQVRKNWSLYFREVSGLRADAFRWAVSGDEVWVEVHFHGIRADGSPFDLRGVMINGVREDRVQWARLYIEETEGSGNGIEASVQRWARGL